MTPSQITFLLAALVALLGSAQQAAAGNPSAIGIVSSACLVVIGGTLKHLSERYKPGDSLITDTEQAFLGELHDLGLLANTGSPANAGQIVAMSRARAKAPAAKGGAS